jgi:branched-chain amino acid transport system permease protein
VIKQVLVNAVAEAGPIALVASGLSLIFSVSRIFHLAHAITITSSSYAAFALAHTAKLPLFICLIMAILIAAGFGAAIEFLIYRPLRRSGASSEVLLIASLGLVIIGQNCISLIFGDQTNALRSPEITYSLQLFGARITGIQILTIVLSALICTLISLFLTWTMAGKFIRAIACDVDLATIIGIRTDRVTAVTFTLVSATGGLAGILLAYETDLSPHMGFDILLLGLTASIVGGLNSAQGAMLGGVLVSLCRHLAGWYLPTQWQDAVVFLLLLVFMLARPHGIFGHPPPK